MKKIEALELCIEEAYKIHEKEEDGMPKEDENGDYIEIAEETPLTYGMFKNAMATFVEELTQDLKDILAEIPEE